MVATFGVREDHVTEAVMFCVLPSENVPVAVNCCVVPSGMVGATGEIVIETRVAALTVNIVDPLIVPEAAVMLEVPAATLVASPWLPAVLLIVATFAVAKDHVTEVVMFCVLPSE